MSAPPPRLFVDAALTAGARIPLADGQAHYLRTVLRREDGADVRLFNGRDGEWAARLRAEGKRGACVVADARTRPQTSEPDLHLLFAPLKKGSTDHLAQKATELGVSALRPVLTARTNAARVNLDRMRANAVEGAEQTERLTVPEVREPVKFEALLDGWGAGRRLLFCDEAGDEEDAPWGGAAGRARPIAEELTDHASGAPWAVLIGPEGGFTSEERERLRGRDDVTPVTLGPRVLRADTAAIAALSVWQALLGDWGRRRPGDRT